MTRTAAILEFQAIHDQFRPRVLRYLTRLVGQSEAEDLTQSVMLRISGGLPDFRGESSLSTWIYRIATNTALDRLRCKKAPPPDAMELGSDDSEVPQVAQAPSVEATAIREEMNACIREFIERLPENYRTVMVLSELEGFKNDEIAGILGTNLGTVKIRLHRARDKLRKDLGVGCSFHHDEDGGLACDRKPTAPISFRQRGEPVSFSAVVSSKRENTPTSMLARRLRATRAGKE
jgi:RNA polymerase sigma-70 factor (ECF subfamily)